MPFLSSMQCLYLALSCVTVLACAMISIATVLLHVVLGLPLYLASSLRAPIGVPLCSVKCGQSLTRVLSVATFSTLYPHFSDWFHISRSSASSSSFDNVKSTEWSMLVVRCYRMTVLLRYSRCHPHIYPRIKRTPPPAIQSLTIETSKSRDWRLFVV